MCSLIMCILRMKNSFMANPSKQYERFEAEAREQRRGLWQRPDVIEPCVWRKMSREERDMHR